MSSASKSSRVEAEIPKLATTVVWRSQTVISSTTGAWYKLHRWRERAVQTKDKLSRADNLHLIPVNVAKAGMLTK